MGSITEANGKLPNNIDRLIKEHCLKKQEISNRLGLSAKKFSDMLNGRRIIRAIDILEISKLLGVTPNDIFGIPSNAKIPTGILWVTHQKNGKKYLTIVKTDGETVLWERRFLVEHLVDENLEVTDQTLEQETKMFIKSSSTT